MAEDLWATAIATNGKRKLIFRYRANVPLGVDIASYPYLVTITWPYDAANDGRMPDGPTNDRQILFEDLIDPPLRESGNAILVLVRTGEETKIWQWYSRNVRDTFAIINSALSDQPRFPIEIVTEEDANWAVWQKFVASVVKPTQH